MDSSLIISNISRQISLSAEEADFFVSLLQARTVEAGSFLLREGEVCRKLSFISRGCMKTYQTNADGTEHVLDFLIEEWWADDLYSFLTASAATQNIKAIETTTLLQISKSNLELLYQKLPKFERFFRILFQNAYIAQKRHIHSLLSTNATERFQQFRKKKPYAEKRFAQKDIASYLGLTPPFLSSLKKRLRQVNLD